MRRPAAGPCPAAAAWVACTRFSRLSRPICGTYTRTQIGLEPGAFEELKRVAPN